MALALLTTRLLDYQQPVNWAAPLNRGLLGWWLVLPQRLGGSRWLDLVGRAAATLVTTLPSGSTSGWGPSRRLGGLGELRFDGTNGYADLGAPFPTLGSAYSWSLWYRPAS